MIYKMFVPWIKCMNFTLKMFGNFLFKIKVEIGSAVKRKQTYMNEIQNNYKN